MIKMGSQPVSGDFLGQPRGLTILFLTEMWEKFSYYGMRALLVYYMTKELLFDPERASYIYGLYTAIAFFTPIFGGYLSDRWLGKRKAVIIGGSVMAFGHFLMAFPDLLFPALATIALGNGLFLPNLPSQIEQLYEKQDPRRGSAYNIYYVGVNLGAFMAPLVCGTLGEIYGWHYGFGAAGIGMCLGLAIYILGRPYLPVESEGAGRSGTKAEAKPAIPATDGRATITAQVQILLAVIVAVVVFRGAYEQMGNSIALWADGNVDRSIAGFMVPATWFQSLNPLLVFLVTPFLVRRWERRAQEGREISPLVKMAQGALGVCFAYLFLVVTVQYSAQFSITPPMISLVIFIVIYTVAELHILPVGLGLFGRMAGEGYRGTTIAAWFFAAFAGNLLAGYLGSFFSLLGNTAFFTLMAGVSAAAAVMLLAIDRSSMGARVRTA